MITYCSTSLPLFFHDFHSYFTHRHACSQPNCGVVISLPLQTDQISRRYFPRLPPSPLPPSPRSPFSISSFIHTSIQFNISFYSLNYYILYTITKKKKTNSLQRGSLGEEGQEKFQIGNRTRCACPACKDLLKVLKGHSI